MLEERPGWWLPTTVIVIVLSISALILSVADIITWDSAHDAGTKVLTFNWLLLLAASFLFLVWLGLLGKAHPFGILIDTRNKFSLSRLQLILWLTLIASSIGIAFLQNYKIPSPTLTIYFTGAFEGSFQIPADCRTGDVLFDERCRPAALSEQLQTLNIENIQGNLGQLLRDGDQMQITPPTAEHAAATFEIQSQSDESAPEGRDFNIPDEILLLLGISTTSLVGSPLLKSIRDQSADEPSKIARNAKQKEARFSDFVMGEETQNRDQIDLAKVQMLYLTLVLVVAYGVALAEMFQTNAGSVITQFPPVASGVILLLGISHTGYLADKALPKKLTSVAIAPQTVAGEAADSLKVQFGVPRGGSYTTFAWNFGDQTGSGERDPIHEYTAAATYTVRVAAYNETGVSVGQQEVTVPLVSSS